MTIPTKTTAVLCALLLTTTAQAGTNEEICRQVAETGEIVADLREMGLSWNKIEAELYLRVDAWDNSFAALLRDVYYMNLDPNLTGRYLMKICLDALKGQ